MCWRQSEADQLSASRQCCDLYSSHDDFHSMNDVSIARVVTGIHDEHVGISILVVNQALYYLYFGASIDHTLIRPNEIKHYWVPVLDNPYTAGGDFIRVCKKTHYGYFTYG